MRRIIYLIALIMLCSFNAKSQGMEFFHGTYDELLVEAKKQNKKVFIDFYTKWCGPCRMMALKVFPLPGVGEFYNKHFISYKVDAEEKPELAKKYKVNSYPTFIFADTEGNSIYEGSCVGASDEEGFIRLGKLALGLDKKTWAWYQEEYKNGNRGTEFLKGYGKAQFAATGMSLSNIHKMELIKSYPEDQMFCEENAQRIFYAARLDNECYQIIIKNKEKFPQLKTAEDMVMWIMREFGSGMMSRKEARKVYKIVKKEFPQFAGQAYEYYNTQQLRITGKYKEFFEKMYKYVDKYGEPEHFGFTEAQTYISMKSPNPYYGKRLLKHFENVLDEEKPHFFSVVMKAYILYSVGEKEKAQQIAKIMAETTESFKSSKKMIWAFNTMKCLEKGEAPSPRQYKKR
jgi:thiol-disulfide isomerase/thioredoxin